MMSTPRRPNITEEDKNSLRNYFIENSADHWDRNRRLKEVKKLKTARELSHLSKQQISGRWHAFVFEKSLRSNFGRRFFDASRRMVDENFVENSLILVFHECRTMFLESNPYNAIPDCLESFLHTCSENIVRFRGGERVASFLNPMECFIYQSFVDYCNQILMPSYGNIWGKFSILEKNKPEVMGNRPDLFLSDMEFQLRLSVRRWISNPTTNSPQHVFNNCTFMKEVYETIPLFENFEQFESNGERLWPPLFVIEAVQNKNLAPLQRSIFAVFEINFYNIYVSQLFVNANCKVVEQDDVENVMVEENIEATTAWERRMIYYILGAALRKGLDVSRENVREGNFLGSKDEVLQGGIKEDDMFYIDIRDFTGSSLYFPKCDVFEIFINIFENILKPVTTSTVNTSLLGANLASYFTAAIEVSDATNKLYELASDNKEFAEKVIEYFCKTITKNAIYLSNHRTAIDPADKVSFRTKVSLGLTVDES